MKPVQLLCTVLVVAAIGSVDGAAAVGKQPAVTSNDSGAAADGHATSGGRRGRFLSSFLSLLGLQQKVEVQQVHRPIRISPVIVLKPGPIPGSGDCQTADSQCPAGYHCADRKCVQCTYDEHCNPVGRHALTSHQKRCVDNRCVDPWVDTAVKCSKYTPCLSGQYCSAGVCTPFVPDGMPCTADYSCQSNSCLQGKCAECSQWRSCGRGQFCHQGHCEYPGETGGKCWFSFQCQSHICWHGACAECAHSSDCRDAGKYCDHGVCKALRSFGEICSGNSQCSSGLCDTNSRTQPKCVECKNSATCADNSYCDDYHKCVRKSMLQEFCTDNYHCLSNKCSSRYQCIECNRQQDCDSGTQFCDIAGGGTCKELKRPGQECAKDEQCLSPLKCSPSSKKCVQCLTNFDCDGNTRCDIGQGTCVAKSAVDAGCTVDSDCLSGFCGASSGTCVSCRANGHAGGSEGCAHTELCTAEGSCVPTGVEEDEACLSGLNEQCAEFLDCVNYVCISSCGFGLGKCGGLPPPILPAGAESGERDLGRR